MPTGSELRWSLNERCQCSLTSYPACFARGQVFVVVFGRCAKIRKPSRRLVMLGISHRGISSKHTYDIQKSTFEVEAAGIKLFSIEQILEVQATIEGGARGR